jgi:hypothetical protein
MYGEEENSKVLLLRHSIQFFHKHILNEYHYTKQRKTWKLQTHKHMCCFDSVQLLEAYKFHFKKTKTTELASSPQRDFSFLWVTRSNLHLFENRHRYCMRSKTITENALQVLPRGCTAPCQSRNVIAAVAFTNEFIQIHLHTKHTWYPAEDEEDCSTVQPNTTAVNKDLIPVD